MPRRGCKNSPDTFCYVCGSFVPIRQQRNITEFVKKAYYAYFGIKLGDQDKPWAPHTACRTCIEQLRQWVNGERTALPFGIPMVWRQPTDHSTNCYFCSVNVKGFNSRNKSSIVYPSNIPSAILPVPHGPDVPVPQRPEHLQDCPSSESECDPEVAFPTSDCDFSPKGVGKEPKLFEQSALNDFVRDLGLTKESAEILGSRLRERNMLAPGTTYYWFRHREQEFTSFFSEEETLVYCNNIPELLLKLGLPHYDPIDWRLFIDASKRSLKCVLLHNENKLSSVPVAHSVIMRETYENLEKIMCKLNYQEHKWQVCGDFKVIGILLGLQSGYTKHPCFLCEWDSRARLHHWSQKEWPRRHWIVGSKNIKQKTLVDKSNILLPPLHIKLGLMKQFVKALNNEGECFQYLCHRFPGISNAKIKEGIFTGPDIRKLLSDAEFEAVMCDVERSAWKVFRDVVKNFLGNRKDSDYKQMVERMLVSFQDLGCKMSLKLHMLHSHLDYFPENLGMLSEEQGERFHQDLKELERRYQGKWNKNMLADYCWLMKREDPNILHTRKARKRSFMN